VLLADGTTKTGVLLGVKNLANKDWGDLPNTYTTLDGSPGGPSHVLYSHFRLGANVSGEINGQPSATATNDTADDGVVLVSGILQPGDNTLRVTVSGVGGSLTGWIDWDKDGVFEVSEGVPDGRSAKLIWRTSSGTVLGDEADLTPGTHDLIISSPGVVGPVMARFRWGEQGLNYFGPAMIGEVEDYRFLSSPTLVLPGDYNNDNSVDLADYTVWRKFVGTATLLPNDITPGTVDQSDYVVWQNNFGNTQPGAGAGGGSQSVAASTESEEEPPADASLASPVVVSQSEFFAAPAGQPAGAVNSPAAIAAEPAPAAVSTIIVNSPAAVVDAGPLLSVSPLAIDLAVSGDTSSSFATTSDLVQSESVIADSTSGDADLLLLDQILADLADDDDDDPLVDRFGQDEDGVGDLELAAVFDDESNWWGV
jgi:hypothetical protein